MANSDDVSTAAYLKQHNDTTGAWLKKAGYYSAFFGKYVNGCEGQSITHYNIVPPFSKWRQI